MSINIERFLDVLAYEKKYSKHTIDAYRNDLYSFQKFVHDFFAEVDSIDEVDYDVIRQWISSLLDKGISNRTVNRKVSALKVYFSFLCANEVLRKNPLATHKALKTSSKPPLPLSEKEMEDLVGLMSISLDELSFDHARDRLMLELLYATGIRRAELINLRMQDVDFQKKQLKVLGKRNKERIVPLLHELIDLFAQYIDKRSRLKAVELNDYLFLNKNAKKLNEVFVYRRVNAYLSNVTVKEKRSTHVLRHTFASHVLKNGGDLRSIQQLLGHQSLAATQVYTTLNVQELQKVHRSSHPRNVRK